MSKLKLIELSEPVDRDDLSQFELEFGISLPASLKNHFLSENGGVPDSRKMYFIPEGEDPAAVDEVTFNGFFPIKHLGAKSDVTLETTYRNLIKQNLIDPKSFIPFAFDVSGYPFLMDLNTQKIYLLDRDNIDNEGKESIEFVADSLEEFIEGLMPFAEYESLIG